MPTGVDFSAGRVPASAILAAGHTFCVRYVDDPVFGFNPKLISPAEYAELVSAGLTVALVFERSTTDITDGAGGHPEGAAHAARAVAGAKAIGYPRGSVIFLAVDEHVGPDLIPVALAYLTGAGMVLGEAGFRMGVYGFSEVIEAARSAGLGECFWQCGHDPGPASGVHIWQRNTGTQTIAGIPCDVNVLYRPLLAPLSVTEDPMNIPITIYPDGTFRGVVNAECGSSSQVYADGFITWTSSWGATVWTVSCQGDDGRGNTAVLPGQIVDRAQTDNTRGWVPLPSGTVKVTVEGRIVDKGAIPSAMWVPVPR